VSAGRDPEIASLPCILPCLSPGKLIPTHPLQPDALGQPVTFIV